MKNRSCYIKGQSIAGNRKSRYAFGSNTVVAQRVLTLSHGGGVDTQIPSYGALLQHENTASAGAVSTGLLYIAERLGHYAACDTLQKREPKWCLL